MQISALKKLLQLISPSESPLEEKSSAATSEQETESDLQNLLQQAADKAEDTEANDASELEELLQSEEDDALGYSDEIVAEGDEDHAEERVMAQENRAHLISSVPRAARVPTGIMTKSELREIREIFSNLDDMEIQRLYKKVTKNN